MKNIDDLMNEIFARASLINEDQIITESSLKEYMALQIRVGQLIAKQKNVDVDSLFTDTQFPLLFAQIVDRNKDSLPTPIAIATKIAPRL